MAMTYRASATLDDESEAALYRLMERTGWTKSQVLRWAIVEIAREQGLMKRPASKLHPNTRARR
jgi:hypothetical protein